MYARHFGLSQPPFSIAPDPRYLFMSERHREALAHLLYGVRGGGGFVVLTGEIGAGKTTVCRCLLQQIPDSCDVAYIFNPKLTVEELLSTICVEFGIACPPGNASIKVFVDCINAYLLDALAYPSISDSPARLGSDQTGNNCATASVGGLPAISMPAGLTAKIVATGERLVAGED